MEVVEAVAVNAVHRLKIGAKSPSDHATPIISTYTTVRCPSVPTRTAASFMETNSPRKNSASSKSQSQGHVPHQQRRRAACLGLIGSQMLRATRSPNIVESFFVASASTRKRTAGNAGSLISLRHNTTRSSKNYNPDTLSITLLVSDRTRQKVLFRFISILPNP